MELRHIYTIAMNLKNIFDTDDLVGADISDIELNVKLSPSTLYGIDREFYRQTHDGSIDGFVHNKKIDANIDNVHFVLTEKENSPE